MEDAIKTAKCDSLPQSSVGYGLDKNVDSNNNQIFTFLLIPQPRSTLIISFYFYFIL